MSPEERLKFSHDAAEFMKTSNPGMLDMAKCFKCRSDTFSRELKSVCDTINILLWHRSVLLKLCWQNSRYFMILNCVVCWVSLYMGPELSCRPDNWWLSSSETELRSNSVSQIYLLISDVLEWLSDSLGSSTSAQDLQTGLTLLEDIGRRALRTNTVLMVDAEYTYINPALTALTLALALRCNKDKPIVWNTTQCYLKVTSSLLPMMFIALTNSWIIFLL